jgi:SAM-dependent methyltransferase
LSETRFFEETGWPRRLDDEILLEVGSGSGRFTEHAVKTGAMVLSLDYSRAVEANYQTNGHHENLVLVQGDLFHMPFPRDYATRVLCLGVMQHTPDPRSALRSLVPHLQPGGELVADIYLKTVARYLLGTKYWVRPLTRRVPPHRLHAITSRYVDLVWPAARKLSRIPKVGRALSWRLLIADYSEVIDDDQLLREWARLEAFDMLSPRYDNPARQKTVRRWCSELGLKAVRIRKGYNGLEIRARRPLA